MKSTGMLVSSFVKRTHDGEYVALEVRVEQACASEERARPGRVEVVDHGHEMGEHECDLPAAWSALTGE